MIRRIGVLTLVLAGFNACRGEDALVRSNVDTAAFDGEYALDAEASFVNARRANEAVADAARRAQGVAVLAMLAERYANFRVRDGVIRSGTKLVQEFSLKEARIEVGILRGKAVWHEDVGDPGDMSDVAVMLRLEGDVLEFSMMNEAGEPDEIVKLRKKR